MRGTILFAIALVGCGSNDKDGDCTDAFYADADGDGHGDPDVATTGCSEPEGYALSADDCDDTNATVFPGATEVCDALDNDCNQAIDDEPVNAVTWHADLDDDGFGDDVDPTVGCMPPKGSIATGGDCDDTDANTNPDAVEICDDADNDCDELVDSDDPGVSGAPEWHADSDHDDYGATGAGTIACHKPAETVEDATDCDDTDGTVHPEATERCDGVDNDCDTFTDDDDATVTGTVPFYVDTDGDGFGVPDLVESACIAPAGYTDNADDCDDTDVSIGEALDYYYDNDDDGYGTGLPTSACTPPVQHVLANGDCDPTNAAVNPDATETCDGVDNNCDLLFDEADPLVVYATFYGDLDGDGYGADTDKLAACDPAPGYVALGGDCDEAATTTHPGAEEVCANKIDEDCDGAVDDCEVPLDDAELSIHAPVAYSYVGANLAVADIDDDGTADVLTGTPLTPGDNGEGYVVYGPASGSLTTDDVDTTITTATADAQLGTWIAGGDADDDGIDDLAISAAGASANAAYLFLGPVTADHDVIDADATLSSGTGVSTFTGVDVDVVPDVDGDGVADLVIGAPSGGAMSSGLVYVASGASSGSVDLTTSSTYVYKGANNYDHLGNAADVGDMNGDGLDEIATLSRPAIASGVLYLVEGGEPAGSYDVDVVAVATVSAAGPLDDVTGGLTGADYDGDGTSDLFASGLCLIGPLAGAYTTADADVRWESENLAGDSVAAGDVDGDGGIDVLLGDTSAYDLGGAAFLQLGFTSGTVDATTLVAFAGNPLGGSAGTAVDLVPDWSGDGKSEIAVGATLALNEDGDPAGAVYVVLSDGRY